MKSCTVIVTAANDFTRRVHERMPVILEQFEPWLTGVTANFVLAMREIREQDNHLIGEALGGKRPVADR